MSNGVAEIRNNILNTLRNESTAVPGRAGETPISNLANEFSKLQENKIRFVIEAFVEIIKNPPGDFLKQCPRDFWSDIVFLIRFIPEPLDKRSILIPLFRSLLLGEEKLPEDLRVYALHGFIACGGTLKQKELEKDLVAIRESAPIAWLSSAALSGLFVFVTEQTLLLFKEGAISGSSVNVFLLGFDGWRKNWPSQESFDDFAKRLVEVVPDKEGREKIRRWLQNRGL